MPLRALSFEVCMLKFSALCILSVVLGSSMAFAKTADELSAQSQLDQVLQGKPLLLKTPVKGSWAILTIYEFIPNVTPREAAAITMDWGRKASYTKDGGLLKSEVETDTVKFGGAEASVDYSVTVPLLGKEDFTMKNEIKPYDNGQSFEVDSTMTKSGMTKSSVVKTTLESYNDQGTIMKIVSQTDPPHLFVSRTEGTAIDRTMATSDDFVKHAVSEKTSNSPEFQAELSSFDKAMEMLLATPGQ